MIVFYHRADLDGLMSAAIIKQWFYDTQQDNHDDLILYGWDYSDALPELIDSVLADPTTMVIPPSEKVLLVDISFPMWFMLELRNHIGAQALTVIDHHKSFINQFYALESQTSEILFNTVFPKGGELLAGCELTYREIYPEVPIPTIIEYVGCYDTYRHKDTSRAQNVLNVQYALRSLVDSVETARRAIKYSEAHPETDIPNLIKEGAIIHRYLKLQAKKLVDRNVVELKLHKKKLAVLNVGGFNPKSLGIDFEKMGYDGFISYSFSGNKWRHTIYSDKFDCAEFAEKYGGGGHKGAAGFSLTYPIIDTIDLVFVD